MSSPWQPPSKIEILAPMRTVKKPRGKKAVDNADPQRTVRISDNDIESIDEAAFILGVTRSEFMRWVSYAAANELLRLHREAVTR